MKVICSEYPRFNVISEIEEFFLIRNSKMEANNHHQSMIFRYEVLCSTDLQRIFRPVIPISLATTPCETFPWRRFRRTTFSTRSIAGDSRLCFTILRESSSISCLFGTVYRKCFPVFRNIVYFKGGKTVRSAGEVFTI